MGVLRTLWSISGGELGGERREEKYKYGKLIIKIAAGGNVRIC